MLITFSDSKGVKYVLDINHSELFFGSILVGANSEAQELVFENKGWADISLKEITIAGSAFAIESVAFWVLQSADDARDGEDRDGGSMDESSGVCPGCSAEPIGIWNGSGGAS